MLRLRTARCARPVPHGKAFPWGTPNDGSGGTVQRVLVQMFSHANGPGTQMMLLAEATTRRTAAVHHSAACGGLKPVFCQEGTPQCKYACSCLASAMSAER